MSSVGDLVAHLTADTKQWQAGLDRAGTDLSSFAKTAAVSIAGIAASFATVDFAKGAIAAAEADLAASRKLEAVFRSTGFAAGVTTEEIEELAGGIQRLSKFEDDAVVGAAALLATFTNIKGANFKEALQLAADMAVVMDVDLLSATKKLGKQLDDLSPEEVGVKLHAMASRYGGAAAEAVTATEKVNLALGSVLETVGKKLMPAVDLFAHTAVPALYDAAEAGQEFQTVNEELAHEIKTTGIVGAMAFDSWLGPIDAILKGIRHINEE
jgi:hypothetical protein